MTSAQIRVLLVEDDEDHALLIRECLAQARVNGGTTLDHAPSVPEALVRVAAGPYDVFLIDYYLGADDGLSFLRQVRAKGIDIPAILLTNQGSEEVAVEAMKAGVVDYLQKSKLAPGPLGAAVHYAVEMHRSRGLQMLAEEALRESEARYRRIFDQALTGNYVTTPGGQILACNGAFARILGFDSVEDALAARAYNLYPDAESRQRLLDRLREHGQLDHFETELRRRDGAPIQVLENVIAIRDASGGIVEMQGSILDITERKQTEEALRTKTQELDRYFSASPDLLCIADTQGFFRRLNPEWEKALGWALDELEGRRFLDFVHPDDLESTLEALSQLVAQRDLPRFVNRYRRKDGTYRWLEWRSYPKGDLIYAVARDITERKRDEDTLRKLTRAVEQSPALIMITDATGRIEYVNPKFTEATGFTPEEAIGQTARILKSGKTPLEVYQELWRTLLAGREWSGEILNRTKKGDLRWFSARISPLRGPDDAITHFIAVQQDISEKRSLEQQLRQSQKMEAVGRLAGGVAHDFNNLLGVILGYAELLLRGADPSDATTRRVDQIYKAAERAAGLTRQLLAFSRKQVLEPKVVSLNAIVEDTEKLLRRLMGEDVEMIVSREPRLDLVKADPGQIGQVLINLAVNARDAMPQGGHLVIETANVVLDEAYAQCHAGVSAGPHVLVAVSDTGVGMDPETRSRVFEPFFTTKPQGKGTGLGLSTVYGIVQQSSGHVTVYSELGTGSTFKVYLPRVEQYATPVPATRAREPFPTGTETILLVEDEASLRAIIGETLSDAGYTVIEAGSPQQARALADARVESIDLLVTDVIMPEMNGRELARVLVAGRPRMKVLFMSGYTDDAILQHGVLEPGIAFLGKPFTAEALARKVRDLLGAAA